MNDISHPQLPKIAASWLPEGTVIIHGNSIYFTIAHNDQMAVMDQLMKQIILPTVTEAYNQLDINERAIPRLEVRHNGITLKVDDVSQSQRIVYVEAIKRVLSEHCEMTWASPARTP